MQGVIRSEGEAHFSKEDYAMFSKLHSEKELLDPRECVSSHTLFSSLCAAHRKSWAYVLIVSADLPSFFSLDHSPGHVLAMLALNGGDKATLSGNFWSWNSPEMKEYMRDQ